VPQSVQDDDAEAEYFPAEHCSQVRRSTEDLYPALHSMQALLPAASETLPDGHGEQEEDPGVL